MAAVNLTAPWFTFRNKVLYSFGASKLIYVTELEEKTGGYNLKIIVLDDKVAKALREVLPLQKVFGSVSVFIEIVNNKGSVLTKSNQLFTPQILANTFCAALYSNPLYKGLILTTTEADKILGDVILLIDKSIIQFFNDDLSDIYRNYNEIASNVFEEVSESTFTGNIRASFSTFDEDSALNSRLLCKRPVCKCCK